MYKYIVYKVYSYTVGKLYVSFYLSVAMQQWYRDFSEQSRKTGTLHKKAISLFELAPKIN